MAKFLAGHLSPSRRLLSNTPKSTAFVISETHQLQWLNFWSATCLQVAAVEHAEKYGFRNFGNTSAAVATFLVGHLSPSRRLLSNTPKSTAFVISEAHQLQWPNFWSATCLQVADCCRTPAPPPKKTGKRKN